LFEKLHLLKYKTMGNEEKNKPDQNQSGRNRREEKLTRILAKKLDKRLKRNKLCIDVEVRPLENLQYGVLTIGKVNKNKDSDYYNPKNARRGSNAFQVDILITDKARHIPLVVIELKCEKFTTHDVITYSQKALKHKCIYPHLRYGFVIMCGGGQLERRFFIHNQGMDFAYVINCQNNSFNQDLQNLTEIVIKQIQSAYFLLDIFSNKKKEEKIKAFSEVICWM